MEEGFNKGNRGGGRAASGGVSVATIVLSILLGLALLLAVPAFVISLVDLVRVNRLDGVSTHITCVKQTPSGAPTTNDGFAYYAFCYNDDTLWISGQNGYDTCGNLVNLDTYANGTIDIWTRAWISYMNVKDIMECMNMPMSQLPQHTVMISDFGYRNLSDSASNTRFLGWRSQINTIQRHPYFWGPDPAHVPARSILGAYWLSRGDAVEITPIVVPRTHRHLKTCDKTGVATATALALQLWTINGTKPVTDMPIQALGTGPCS